MYFFYFDESGSRDPSVGTPDRPKDHLYVLLAVGMYERQWRPFDLEISRVKLELADYLAREGKGKYDLADCEIKSNWIRRLGARAKHSPFLNSLDTRDMNRLIATYYQQITERKTVLLATVMDKRELYPNVTHDALHRKAYEFLLVMSGWARPYRAPPGGTRQEVIVATRPLIVKVWRLGPTP